MIPSKF